MTKLNDENLCGLTTDGAPAMDGNQNGFMSLMRKCVKQNIKRSVA